MSELAPLTAETIAEKAREPVERVERVFLLIAQTGAFASELILREMSWFYGELGLDTYYFETTPPEVVAKHIQSLYAAKILARTSGETIDLQLETEAEGLVTYACRDDHDIAVEIERRIEQKFQDYRVQSYRTTGTTSSDSESHLRLYFLSRPDFPDVPVAASEVDLEKVSSRTFSSRIGDVTNRYYKELMDDAVREYGPTIRALPRPDKQSKQILVALHRGTTHSYFSAISDVLNSYGVKSCRKYVEQFANGMVFYSIYLSEDVPDEVLESIQEDLSLVFVLPKTSLTPLFQQGELSAQEVAYAYCGWKFAHQFLTRYRDEYATLAQALADDPVRLGLLAQLKLRLAKDTFTEHRIYDAIVASPELIKALYADFVAHHLAGPDRKVDPIESRHDEALKARIQREVSSEIDEQILCAFLTFNSHVLATNFYKDDKVAFAFRLDPGFLRKSTEYRDLPFGIYFFVGSEFRGFQVRFTDVARGGFRIIRSPNHQAFSTNIDRLFQEAYQLSHTQQKKNKDIPEGGSKAALLLSLEHQDKAEVAFKKCIDSLLDLMLPSDDIHSHLGGPEILFVGPDEGTAELMDWASQHARTRGYPFWKAFTTGKSVELGGIPHDVYGMTTRSVHQYVLGILEKCRLDEREVTKVQTGGPDGDLGSNEIKISKDRTLAVVDGSGVLYDPRGIDRHELLRLADSRQPVSHFDRGKLGTGGFLVTVDDRDVRLPDGRLIESGFVFRNNFHLDPLCDADLFVPCGGRPDAVHINNVDQLFDERGRPRFRFLVEGANLFFSQEARLALERAGVIVYKDASANKGGVTSSSLEVFAALALADDEFAVKMTVHGEPPEFYRRYVEEVQRVIESNARLEFECIWREHERTGIPRSSLADSLSDRINALNYKIQESGLWSDAPLRQAVLQEACPEVLLETVGLAQLLERVPENYLRAIFGAYLASQYIYSCGMAATEVEFYDFLGRYKQR